jgi:hypothetical protein
MPDDRILRLDRVEGAVARSAQDRFRLVRGAKRRPPEHDSGPAAGGRRPAAVVAVPGARRGEVMAMKRPDVNLAAGTARLDENFVRTADGMLLTVHRGLRSIMVTLGENTILRRPPNLERPAIDAQRSRRNSNLSSCGRW